MHGADRTVGGGEQQGQELELRQRERQQQLRQQVERNQTAQIDCKQRASKTSHHMERRSQHHDSLGGSSGQSRKQ